MSEVEQLKSRCAVLESTVAVLVDRVRYLEERAVKAPPKGRG